MTRGAVGTAGSRLTVFLGAFGDAGHAFPMLALGSALVARGHEVHFETWKRWRPHADGAKVHVIHPRAPLAIRSWDFSPGAIDRAIDDGYDAARRFLG